MGWGGVGHVNVRVNLLRFLMLRWWWGGVGWGMLTFVWTCWACLNLFEAEIAFRLGEIHIYLENHQIQTSEFQSFCDRWIVFSPRRNDDFLKKTVFHDLTFRSAGMYVYIYIYSIGINHYIYIIYLSIYFFVYSWFFLSMIYEQYIYIYIIFTWNPLPKPKWRELFLPFFGMMGFVETFLRCLYARSRNPKDPCFHWQTMVNPRILRFESIMYFHAGITKYMVWKWSWGSPPTATKQCEMIIPTQVAKTTTAIPKIYSMLPFDGP